MAKPAKRAPRQKPPSTIATQVAAERDVLFDHYWEHRDPGTLRVWADALIERGDPRGEYIQMCLLEAPTAEQLAIRKAYEKRHHGKLAGPARPFLREFVLGANGLVERTRCEADLLVQGLPVIERLNPQLALSITSIDAKGAGLEGCSLERIYHVNFAWGVIGSQSDANMKESTLRRIAPALRRVRHLSLQCAGYRDQCFTPAALYALGETLECLEYLAFCYHDSRGARFGNTERGLAPIEEYAHAIATAPGFRNLKVLFIRTLIDRRAIEAALPRLVHLETLERGQPGAWMNTSVYENSGMPGAADELEPLKLGNQG